MKTITIYTKDYCPYCTRAKTLLESEGLPYQEVDITNDPESFESLKKRSELMTVPQIFVDDILIGGSDDLARKIEEVKEMMR